MGIPPFSLNELCIRRWARDRPDALAIADGKERLTYADLAAEIGRVAGVLASSDAPIDRAVLSTSTTLDGVIVFFAALEAGFHVQIRDPARSASATASFASAPVFTDAERHRASAGSIEKPESRPRGLTDPILAISTGNRLANHSHHSLLGSTIGLATFLDLGGTRPWLATLPLERWEGILSVLVPLYAGLPLILAEPDAETFADTIQREQVAFAFQDLATVADWTRQAKKPIKRARGTLEAMLLSCPGAFEADTRRRVAKAFDCPALTVFGLPETGPIFVAHPSWCPDDSIGIPLSNMNVVPADPRTGLPIQTWWDQVNSAEVTVRGPSVMCGYDGMADRRAFLDGRFRTDVVGSSDANGMIYLAPDWSAAMMRL